MVDQKSKYLKTHEWARQETGNTVVVGLSSFAIEQLGDIVYMELPQVGEEFTAGDPFGVVESVKSASDMYVPVSGKVVAINQEPVDNPDMLKTDAYDKGWLIKLEMSDASQFDGLMDAAAYTQFLETEAE